MNRWVAGLFAVLSLVLNAGATETSATGTFLLASKNSTTALLLVAAAVVIVLYLMRRRRRIGTKP
jgi:hypothetical protein